MADQTGKGLSNLVLYARSAEQEWFFAKGSAGSSTVALIIQVALIRSITTALPADEFLMAAFAFPIRAGVDLQDEHPNVRYAGKRWLHVMGRAGTSTDVHRILSAREQEALSNSEATHGLPFVL